VQEIVQTTPVPGGEFQSAPAAEQTPK
jgi:hypothetical protein